MSAAIDSIKSGAPPVGATLAGWPWWAVAILLVASCGSSWVMGWLDVIDRVRGWMGGAEAREDREGPSSSGTLRPGGKMRARRFRA
jgi:hypothetical protein